MLKNKIFTTALSVVLLIVGVSLAACKSTTPAANNTGTPNATAVPPGPIRGTVINSDSIVTAMIQNITAESTGYPWTVDVLIQNTSDVNDLPNPVKDSVGKTVTVVTDQDMTSFTENDVVTAKIKYVGDANIQGGIRLYMYNIVAAMP